jgi:hypothetical protein
LNDGLPRKFNSSLPGRGTPGNRLEISFLCDQRENGMFRGARPKLRRHGLLHALTEYNLDRRFMPEFSRLDLHSHSEGRITLRRRCHRRRLDSGHHPALLVSLSRGEVQCIAEAGINIHQK